MFPIAIVVVAFLHSWFPDGPIITTILVGAEGTPAYTCLGKVAEPHAVDITALIVTKPFPTLVATPEEFIVNMEVFELDHDEALAVAGRLTIP